jgi:hypothetical protein
MVAVVIADESPNASKPAQFAARAFILRRYNQPEKISLKIGGKIAPERATLHSARPTRPCCSVRVSARARHHCATTASTDHRFRRAWPGQRPAGGRTGSNPCARDVGWSKKVRPCVGLSMPGLSRSPDGRGAQATQALQQEKMAPVLLFPSQFTLHHLDCRLRKQLQRKKNFPWNLTKSNLFTKFFT